MAELARLVRQRLLMPKHLCGGILECQPIPSRFTCLAVLGAQSINIPREPTPKSASACGQDDQDQTTRIN